MASKTTVYNNHCWLLQFLNEMTGTYRNTAQTVTQNTATLSNNQSGENESKYTRAKLCKTLL